MNSQILLAYERLPFYYSIQMFTLFKVPVLLHLFLSFIFAFYFSLFFFDSFLYQCYSCWFRCFVHSHSLALCISKCCFSILYIHDCSSHKIRLRLFSDIAIFVYIAIYLSAKMFGLLKVKRLVSMPAVLLYRRFCFFDLFHLFHKKK